MLDFDASVTLLGSLVSCFVLLSIVDIFGLNIPTFNLVVIGCVFTVGIGKFVCKSLEGIGWDADWFLEALVVGDCVDSL